MAEEVKSGYVPGRALSPEQYSGGFVDFYKDYLGATGIRSSVPVDDDDKDDDEDTYQAPNILDSSNPEDNETNLLSSVFSSNNLSGGQTYLDANVDSVDLQSMDLSHGSWDDYKKSNGLADKSSFNSNLAIASGGFSLAGTAGGMIGGALLGTPRSTPWGVSNPGAGIFYAAGDKADSLKYDATMEVRAAKDAFSMVEGAVGDPNATLTDTGAAINIDGQYLVRRPGSMQFIGTLPQGISNQQVHNLIALKEGKLPNYLGGAGTENGFGITGLGGYNADGRFVDANGQIAQYGPAAARDALAAQKFGGNTPEGRKQADAYLADLRNRGFFESGVRTYEEAKRMLDLASGAIQPTVKPGGGYPNRTIDSIYNPPEEDTNYTPSVPRPLDDDYNTYTGANIGFNMGRSGFPSGGSTTPVSRQNLRTGEEEDSTYTPNVPSPLDDDYNTYSGANIGFNTRGTSFNTRAGTQYVGTGVPSAGRSFSTPGRSSLSTLSQTPTSLFNDMKNRGFTNKQATDVLNTIIPDVQPKKSFLDGVVPASFTQPSSDNNNNDDNNSPSTDTRDDTADPVGLDAFGGAGEPVNNSGGGDSGGSSDKIVCTAMNNAYGFGSFRQTIWLKHSQNLDPAYQLGYHKLFRPLVKYAYIKDSLPNRIIKKWLEGVAKRRTADIWLQSRNKKRPIFGKIERALLEPICYIAGKI